MKILVAEDDAVARLFLKAILKGFGHEVILCADGRAALEAFREHRPYIVISDWMMPEIDGLELCQRIRAMELEQYTYFILQTARNRAEDSRLAMDAGVDDFLAKPVKRDDLFTRLRVAERIIQQRVQSERKIRMLARFPADNPNPVVQVDRGYQILYANTASLALLAQWECSVGEPVTGELRGLAETLFATGSRQEVEVSCAGRIYSFSSTSVSPEGEAYFYGHDVTERRQAERELLQLKNEAEEHALHDQLTGLPNRRLFGERLQQETARAVRMGTKVALVMVDIDNFKQINDGFGHKVGDEVIVTVAHGLRSRLRPTDTVCRWGGDEMVLLITDLKDRPSVATICSKLTRGVKQETSKSSTSATVSLSMGSALFPDDSDDPTLLMQQADHALYSAKADGRDCWREFKGFPDGHDAKGKADLFIRLSKAVAENRISTFYQPIISTRTRKVEGAETLARWNDEKYGWVSPDVFIPLAEDKGLILQLGNLVIVQALDQLADWRQRRLDLTVSINLSKRQLLHAEFLPGLIGLMKERQLQPEWVILEITERQSVLGQAVGRQRLEELATAGFRISIDDFGSGYSSFDLVGEASFSELKIHLALIRLTNTQRGRRIVQAIVEMGRSLNLRVVAEGVEDQVTQAMLTALGVDKLQGYLFSKPLDPAAFLRYMERGQVSLRRAA